jgi:hypothetical protein
VTYAALMVHVDLGAANDGLLQIAADLAQRCKARVIGLTACRAGATRPRRPASS